jgi:hypothetical protein
MTFIHKQICLFETVTLHVHQATMETEGLKLVGCCQTTSGMQMDGQRLLHSQHFKTEPQDQPVRVIRLRLHEGG